MKKFKEILRRLLFPPVWVVLICTVCAAALLIFVFVKEYDNSPLAYFSYAFSAYSFCIFLALVIPNASSGAKKLISKIPLMNKYFNDKIFRAHISIYMSLIVNTAYSVFYFVMAIVQKSYWQVTLALYNFVFSLMRFVLVKNYSKAKKEKNEKNRLVYELKSYRLCGIFMLLMSLTMTGMIELMISDGKNTGGEIITITIAAYTFYCFVIAIINVINFRKQNSPILLASKNVCFARALMSLFSLQITMFSQFGDGDISQHIMNIAVGLVTCVLCVATAVIMIVKANKKIKIIDFDKI
ncbi:MAG: hypothetical protein ACI4IQ_07875 [Eubacterium sp.]